MQRIARCSEVVGQTLRQALVEGGVLHVDDYAADFLSGDLFGQQVGLILGRQAAQGHVAGPIGEQDYQRSHVGVDHALLFDDLMSHIQSRGQGRFSTHGDIDQSTLGELDRIGGGQHQGGAILLEDDQPHPVAPLVGIGQQGEDSPLSGRHALGNRHRPGSIHYKKHQIGRFFDPHFTLQVAGLNRKRHFLALLGAPFLMGRGGADSGVECNIAGFSVGGSRLNVAAAFALRAGAGAAASPAAGEPVDGGIQLAGQEGFSGLDLFAPLPPIGVAGIEDILLGRFGRALRMAFFADLRFYATLFFFSPVSCSSDEGVVSSDSMLAPCNCSMRSCSSVKLMPSCWKGPRLMRCG